MHKRLEAAQNKPTEAIYALKAHTKQFFLLSSCGLVYIPNSNLNYFIGFYGKVLVVSVCVYQKCKVFSRVLQTKKNLVQCLVELQNGSYVRCFGTDLSHNRGDGDIGTQKL